MAFVGNFTTGAVVPTPLFGRSPADKGRRARSVKMLAERSTPTSSSADGGLQPACRQGRPLRGDPRRGTARWPTVRRAGGSTW